MNDYGFASFTLLFDPHDNNSFIQWISLEYLLCARHFVVDIIIADLWLWLLLLFCHYYYVFYPLFNKSSNQRNLKAYKWQSWNFIPQTLNEIPEFKTVFLVWW